MNEIPHWSCFRPPHCPHGNVSIIRRNIKLSYKETTSHPNKFNVRGPLTLEWLIIMSKFIAITNHAFIFLISLFSSMSIWPKHTILQWTYYKSILYFNEHITKACRTSMTILPKHTELQWAYYQSIPNFNEHITKAYRTSMSIWQKHTILQWTYYQSIPNFNEHITKALIQRYPPLSQNTSHLIKSS